MHQLTGTGSIERRQQAVHLVDVVAAEQDRVNLLLSQHRAVVFRPAHLFFGVSVGDSAATASPSTSRKKKGTPRNEASRRSSH
jgi:hypothetical protein